MENRYNKKMRRLLIMMLLLLSAWTSSAQESLLTVSKNYYRSDPFKTDFSKFLQHLLNDPTLINKRVLKKTDSTLFYLESDYSTHKPFFFNVTRTRIILAEREEMMIVDTLSYLNTVYYYQLIGYAPPGDEGLKDIMEEFEKFSKRYRKGFTNQKLQKLGSADQPLGVVCDFYFPHIGFYPLTVAWATTKDHGENLFAITIRFQVQNNQAFIPLFSSRSIEN